MTISKFKAACVAVLEKVRRSGQPVRITRAGEPVAEIVPVSSSLQPKNWLGSFRSTGQIRGGIVSPASDEAVWDAWSDLEGRPVWAPFQIRIGYSPLR